MPTLQIHLLGDFRLVYDCMLVTTIVQARLQALLAYPLLPALCRAVAARHGWAPLSTEGRASALQMLSFSPAVGTPNPPVTGIAIAQIPGGMLDDTMRDIVSSRRQGRS